MKLRFSGASGVVLALFLAGCAQNSTPNSANDNFFVAGFRDMALGRAYDRAQLALARGDQSQLDDLGAQIRARLARNPAQTDSQDAQLARVFVAKFVGSAAVWEEQIARSSGEMREQSLKKAAQNYRSALLFVPEKSGNPAFLKSLGAQNLNSLGYFLADRGKNLDDWTRAEMLTRMAVELSPKQSAVEEYQRAVYAQDSHAWALYRLGRFAEARDLQKSVLQLVGKSNNVGETNLSPDIPFHMGAIYVALGESKKARQFFDLARTLGADDTLQDQIEILEKSRAI